MNSVPASAGRSDQTFSPVLGEKVFLCPAAWLKKSASCVLASFRASTYGEKYASPLHSLRPCWPDFLNRLQREKYARR